MTFYDEIRDVAVEVLAEFKQGAVTLTRTTLGASDPSTPWIPGAPTADVYELDAVVSGVTKKYIDGSLILASDLMVTASPRATHSDGTVVEDIAPQQADIITVDGAVKAVKAVKPTPAAGTAAAYLIFIAG